MHGEELRSVFLAAAAGKRAEDPLALATELASRVEAGSGAWPTLPLDPALFVRHLAQHATPALPPAKFAADVWLACACAARVPGAVEAFAGAYKETVERAAARVNRGAADDVAQAVMVALFVAEEGSRPRIAEYGGRAALRTWLATVTTNAALNRAQRKENQEHASLAGLGVAAAALEPELALAKARYGGELDAALRAALDALDKRHRVLLRLHHMQGWTMERLATMYRVSRSAAGRLVVEAREALLEGTKMRLQERLKLTPSELQSLIVLLQSSLQVSLARVLSLDE